MLSRTRNLFVLAAMLCTVAVGFSRPALGAPEFRAFWADIWHEGYKSAAEVDAMVGRAVTGRYNAIVVEVLGYHDNIGTAHGAFWNSNIVPRAACVVGGFDSLGYLVEQAHANGIEVHAWMVAFRVCVWPKAPNPGDPRPPSQWPPSGNPFLAAHPEFLMVRQADMGKGAWPVDDGNPDTTDDYILDPGSPDVQEYLVSIVRELVENYEIDGIHWDYMRYTYADAGYPADTSYVNSSLARFKRITGYTGTPPPTGYAPWDDFRRRTITELVRRTRAELPTIPSTRQPLRHSAAVFTEYDAPATFPESSAWAHLQNWEEWARLGFLDTVVPMAYYGEYSTYYRHWVDKAMGWRYQRHMVIGPGIYVNTFANSVTQMQYARDAGADGICTYSYFATRRDPAPPLYWANDWDWYPYVAANFFTTTATVPTMPWRNPATATEGTLWGRVTDGTNGQPIDDATVQVGSLTPVKTDGNGYYVVTLLSAGPSGTAYDVSADKSGYFGAQQNDAVVPRGGLVRANLALREPTSCASILLTGFEGYDNGSTVMFRNPSFSGSTQDDLLASPNMAQVTDAVPAFAGSKCCQVEWQWIDTDPERWLRLTTYNAANKPNPTIELDKPIRVRLRLDSGSFRLCLGVRETGTTAAVGENGGTSGPIEWIGAATVVDEAPQGKLVTANPNVWQTITFDPATDPILGMTGDGELPPAGTKVVLEHLGFAIVDSTGPFIVYLDDIEQWCPGVRITEHPAAQAVCLGSTVQFTVAATGQGTLTYQWQKDEVNLGDGGHYSGVTTTTLTVSNCDGSDAANYHCVVTDAVSTAASNEAALTFESLAPLFAQCNPKLVAADGDGNQFFGNAVALSDDLALIGAPIADGQVADSGAVYVFRLDPAGWVQEANKLEASDGAAGDRFGYSVALSGCVAVVGSPRHGHTLDDSGAVYVFRYDGEDWTQEAELRASDAIPDHFFGMCVAISGDVAVVGAEYDMAGGAAYVFRHGEAGWVQEAKLLAPDQGDDFGCSVAISDDVIVIGECLDADDGYPSGMGAVHIWRWGGTAWVHQGKLTAYERSNEDLFGQSVAISGDTVVIGAPGADGSAADSGAAYVVSEPPEGWHDMTVSDKLWASDALSAQLFGYSVAISGDQLVIGASQADANAGAAYVFRRDGSNWSQRTKLTDPDGAVNDFFGVAVAVFGDAAMIGVPYDDGEQGSAFVFAVSGKDCNCNGIGDACEPGLVIDCESALAVGVPRTINPDGGSGAPTEDALVEITNLLGPPDARIVVTETAAAAPPPEGFAQLGTTVSVDTSLLNGEYKMTISVPFGLADLQAALGVGEDVTNINPCRYPADRFNLMWYTSSGECRLAVADNIAPAETPCGDPNASVGCRCPAGPSEFGCEPTPFLGDYGIFWNAAAKRGYVWANVDHASDFAAAIKLIPGDRDADADVDLDDFARFRACFNGPNRPPAQPACAGEDFDHDTDVDLDDFTVFRGCFNGPNRPPACQ